MKSYARFICELNRLKKLYNASLFCLEEGRNKIQELNKNTKFSKDKKIYLRGLNDSKYIISDHPWDFISRDSGGYKGYMREIIFIRLISALEVFLIDMIRELFTKRKDLFYKEGEKIEFHSYELLSINAISKLWSEFINRKCRKLQNGGFNHLCNYYSRHFNININNFSVNFSYLQKIFEIRHILVHRLGVPDQQFKLKYKYTRKKVSLSEEEFRELIKNMEIFAKEIDNGVEKLNNEKILLQGQNSPEVNFKIKVSIVSGNPCPLLDDQFCFLHGEHIIALKDILKDIILEENNTFITLAGEAEVIRTYTNLLGQCEELIIIDIDKSIKFNEIYLDHLGIKSIYKELPKKRWPTDIHKILAKKLNLDERVISTALALISYSY